VPEHVALSKAESPDKESYDDSIDTVCGKKVGKRKAGAIHGRKNPHADNDCWQKLRETSLRKSNQMYPGVPAQEFGRPRTVNSRILGPQIVNEQLLRLLSTHILVDFYKEIATYLDIKMSNTLYQWI